jgi:hypothetical protein
MEASIHPSIHWWVLVQSGHHHFGQESPVVLNSGQSTTKVGPWRWLVRPRDHVVIKTGDLKCPRDHVVIKNWGSEVGQTPDRVFFDPIKKTKQKKKKKTHYDHLIVYTLLGGSRETTFIHAMEESMCSPPPLPQFCDECSWLLKWQSSILWSSKIGLLNKIKNKIKIKI